MSENLFSVSELNQYIKDVLSAGFPQAVWICGEIQNFRDKKHVYFELVEKDPDSHQVKAKINVAIWAAKKTQIYQALAKSENAFELKDDIEVKLCCSVNFWVQGGSLTLIVEAIDPVYTLGKLAQERQKLIAKLKTAGTLDKNKQRELSVVPLRIGLITSDDSAAYHDFLSELKKSRYAFKVFLRNTIMQGKKAELDVCEALEKLKRVQGLNTVVITRGGGSIAELSCFDSQMIAETIAQYPVPVLSGIGHEINTTVTDLAAHTYAKTPTAIAQLIVGLVDKFLSGLDEKRVRILDSAHDQIGTHKEHLKDLAQNMAGWTHRYFQGHHRRLIQVLEVFKRRPPDILKNSRRSLTEAQLNLIRNIKNRMQQDRGKLTTFEKIMAVAQPLNTIKRGFSITRTKDGKLLRKISQILETQEVVTELFDGNLTSQVKSVSKRKDDHG